MGGFARPTDPIDDVLLRRLVERLPDGVAVWDGQVVRYANPAFHRITGTPAGQDLVGTPLDDLFDPADLAALDRALAELRRERTPPPLLARLHHGGAATVDVELLSCPLKLAEETCALLVLHDVTARTQADERLRISELSYRQLFEGAPEAIYVQDEAGIFLDVNQHAVEMYGYPKEFYVGRTPEALSAPGRNDLEAVAALVGRAFAGETHRFEFWGRRCDGTVFPKEVMVTPGTYFGKPVVVAFARDITERRALEERLLHAQKLEAVGRLAGGIAHDFNNILQAVASHVDLALLAPADEAETQRHLEEIAKASDRGGALVRQLLAFARRQVLEKEPIDLDAIARDMLEMLRRLVRESIEIDLVPADEPLVVLADPGQIEQVLMNLVVNASDAIEGDGRITIQTSRRKADDAFRATRPWAKGGEYAALSVADTGHGVPEAARESLFEPFFTTKSRGKGTGLGLAMVHGIVSQHGGGIDVESPPDGGTRFVVFLPATREVARTRRAPVAASPAPAAPGGRILLAEDDRAVREVVKEGLESAGYEVLVAGSGYEAIAIFEVAPQSIDLAVLDVVMAGGDGREAFRRIRDVRPDVPILFSTGYDEAAVLQGIPKGRRTRTLAKPYAIPQLLEEVASLLAEPA